MMELTSLQLGVAGAIALVVLGALGMRMAYAAGLIGILGLIAILGFEGGLRTAGTVPYSKGASYSMSVLPMFILLGYLAHYAGLSAGLFEACRRWFGRLPGGLATATIFAAAGFGAVSGSSTAAAAVFSRVAIPEMLRERYSKALAAGSVAAGSVLDSVIPPSTLLVVYAILTEQSVATLLVAGFVPGVFSAICYGIIITIRCARNPELAPPSSRFTFSEKIASLPSTIPVLTIIGTIFTAMYYGWATPTEAGALAASFVFVMACLRRASVGDMRDALLDTAKLTVVLFTIIWSISIFVLFLGYADLPNTISEWVSSLTVSPLTVLLVIYLIYLVLGMFIDSIGIMILTLPIVYPVIVGLGFDPIWFGIIVVKLCGIGLLTPPFGLCCFVVSSVRPDIPLSTIFRGVVPFILTDLVVVAVLTAFPGIITFILAVGH